MVEHVLPDAIPIIEGLQPYRRGDAAELDELWILHSLWNADKHRLPTTVAARLHVPKFSGPGGFFEEFDDGSITVRVPKGAEPEKYPEPRIRREVLFEKLGAGPAGRVGLDDLRRIYDIVADEVIPRFARFLDSYVGT